MMRVVTRKDEAGNETVAYVGVLNDWDLAYVEDSASGHVGGERTGTIPFMALDLLTAEYWAGKKQRRLRHDIEAHIWVLPWVFAQFVRGKIRNHSLAGWKTGDWEACRLLKTDYLGREKTFLPSWEDQIPIAVALLEWLDDERHKRYHASKTAKATLVSGPLPDIELSAEVVIADFWQQIRDIATRNPHLAYLGEYLPETDTAV